MRSAQVGFNSGKQVRNSHLRWKLLYTIWKSGCMDRNRVGKVRVDTGLDFYSFYPGTSAAVLIETPVGWVVSRDVTGFSQRLNAPRLTSRYLHWKGWWTNRDSSYWPFHFLWLKNEFWRHLPYFWFVLSIRDKFHIISCDIYTQTLGANNKLK